MNTVTDRIVDPAESAAQWFELISEGRASKDELDRFYRWLELDEKNRICYQEFAQLWEDIPEHCDREEMMRSQGSEDEYVGSPLESGFFTARIRTVVSMAAGLVICLFVVFLITQRASIDETTYVTAYGETREIHLADGSQITLGAKSQLNVKLAKNARVLTLISGQAYFDVAPLLDNKGEKIPFDVISLDMRVHVVGTKFDVRLLNKKALVTVAEGHVQVSNLISTSTPASLFEGQQVAVVGPRLETLEAIVEVDVEDAMSWRTGWLSYSDVKLEEIISDAQRYHSGQITLGVDSLRELRVTTSFRGDQIAQMTEMLENILPVRVYQQKDERILILPR